jgi:hypothetical protein
MYFLLLLDQIHLLLLVLMLVKESKWLFKWLEEILWYSGIFTSILSQAAAKWIQKQAIRSGGYLTQNDVSKILEERIRWLCVFIHNKTTTFLSLDNKPSERVHVVLKEINISLCMIHLILVLLFSGNVWIWPRNR